MHMPLNTLAGMCGQSRSPEVRYYYYRYIAAWTVNGLLALTHTHILVQVGNTSVYRMMVHAFIHAYVLVHMQMTYVGVLLSGKIYLSAC